MDSTVDVPWFLDFFRINTKVVRFFEGPEGSFSQTRVGHGFEGMYQGLTNDRT